MITRHRSRRTPSGGRFKTFRQKRLYEKASSPTLTKLGPRKAKQARKRGGPLKTRLLEIDTAMVLDSKSKKIVKARIKTITENPANRNYVRRNIMTRGTIIDTELGKARITNRPGQEGSISAVLIS